MNNDWQKKTGKTSAIALATLLASCSNQTAQNEVDLQYLKTPNSTTQNRIQALWPNNLVSNPQSKTIDLSDPKAVAEAMGITLDGTPDQKLYDITIIGSRSDDFGPTRPRATVPVTVANVKEAAAFITSMNTALANEQLGTPPAQKSR